MSGNTLQSYGLERQDAMFSEKLPEVVTFLNEMFGRQVLNVNAYFFWLVRIRQPCISVALRSGMQTGNERMCRTW